MTKCVCGYGEEIILKKSNKNYIPKYIHGHNRKNINGIKLFMEDIHGK